MTAKNDRMPPRYSPEFEPFLERAVKLSTNELCDLLDLVGIVFPTTTRQELEEMPEDYLAEFLDEADSRQKVEKFLKEKGV